MATAFVQLPFHVLHQSGIPVHLMKGYGILRAASLTLLDAIRCHLVHPAVRFPSLQGVHLAWSEHVEAFCMIRRLVTGWLHHDRTVGLLVGQQRLRQILWRFGLGIDAVCGCIMNPVHQQFHVRLVEYVRGSSGRETECGVFIITVTIITIPLVVLGDSCHVVWIADILLQFFDGNAEMSTEYQRNVVVIVIIIAIMISLCHLLCKERFQILHDDVGVIICL
mmetsp:Transcript_22411/g.63525  ORF Transcript_22411/g.63525 Transcript_22411/m.63525 type:complete len:222 (-) Transcript_22411:748-1413(-)